MSESCTCSCASPRRRRRPTATLVIACLALFMSLGGTSYAAVKAKSIGSKQLKSNSVTSAKIARNAVTASDIRAGVIDGTKVRAGSIASRHILDGSLTGQDIAPNSIGSQHILDGSVGASDLAVNSIGPQQIADKSLGTGEINDATINLFRDVPTTLSDTADPTGAISTLPSGFTTVRSFSTPAAGTGRTGETLVQSIVSVSAADGVGVTCWISTDGTPRATATLTGAAIIPLTTLVSLKEGDVVQTRCRATDSATITPGASSMVLIRVGD